MTRLEDLRHGDRPLIGLRDPREVGERLAAVYELLREEPFVSMELKRMFGDAAHALLIATEPDVVEEQDGPECETCGRTTCPDARLPQFSEPVSCEYAAIYQELRAAKDCDYGCGRDFTNQELRLWLVPAVERMLAARSEAGR